MCLLIFFWREDERKNNESIGGCPVYEIRDGGQSGGEEMRNVIIALVIGIAFVFPVEWLGTFKAILTVLLVAAGSMYFLLATDKKKRARP